MSSDLRALVIEAPTWGWIGLVASVQGLRLLGLPRRSEQAALSDLYQHYREIELNPDDPFLREVVRQVQAYLVGELREFSVGLDLRGRAPFELAVWAAIGRIPYGQTRTYAWIADQVGEGRGAAQAAGAAVGANPVPIVVPCHRVIGADGSLHGFAGGLTMKARLLALESGQGELELEPER